MNDEILQDQNANTEKYVFNFSKEEVKQLVGAIFKKNYTPLIVLSIVIIIFAVASCFEKGQGVWGVYVGMAVIIVAITVSIIIKHKRSVPAFIDRVSNSTYEYYFASDNVLVKIYFNNEVTKMVKCYYNNIERVFDLGNFLLFVYDGVSYILRKNQLTPSLISYLITLKPKTQPKKPQAQGVLNGFSIALNVLSILSIFGAILTIGLLSVSSLNGQLQVSDLWIFFAFTPIPIASIIFGYVLKAKGYAYKKNVIIGIVVTIILCAYGSFFFII